MTAAAEQIQHWLDLANAATPGQIEVVQYPNGESLVYIGTPIQHALIITPADDQPPIVGFAELGAASQVAMPVMAAALTAVLKLHRPIDIYDECECTDSDKQRINHEDIYEVGLTCNKLYTICGECCRDDTYQTEDCADNHPHGHCYPCPTVTAITAALGVMA